MDEMKAVVSRVQKVGVPLDVVYADIDYMERYTDFTVGKEKWSGFGNYTRQLHKDGLHVFLIFDPAIQVTSNYTPIVDALNMGAGFIEWETVDQENPDVQKLYPLVQNTTIPFDGIWIDMNEPAAFGTNERNPWYFNQTGRPMNVAPLWCDLKNEWENVPYKTVNVYNWGWDAVYLFHFLTFNKSL
ncbi:unnamed protein product [Gongylonema pulchrum]|uniref:Glycoside hydrolase family 31 TIM barrel domain-containing protein n=1 Tax=Gongylonema pulchrum TaxID=637853 RepID=A0A3P7N0U3_9BILA|nr:unnamed protein product [Gongylonema pulchrum]